MSRPARLGALLIGAVLAAPALAEPPPSGTQELSLPGEPWSLLVDLPGFSATRSSARPDGTGVMIQASSPGTGLIVSIFLERRPDLHSTEACERDSWRKTSRSVPPDAGIAHQSVGVLSTVHYLLGAGSPVAQKNVHAYFYRDATCVELHLSKLPYGKADEPGFERVLRSVRFVDAVTPAPAAPAPARDSRSRAWD